MVYSVLTRVGLILDGPTQSMLNVEQPYATFLSGCKWNIYFDKDETEVCLVLHPKRMRNIDEIKVYAPTPRAHAICNKKVEDALVEALVPRIALLHLTMDMLDGNEDG